MFVGERHVLQDGDKPLLSLQALDEVRHGMEAGQGMQWPAVMTWWEIGRPRHREGGGGQHALGRHTGPQLV